MATAFFSPSIVNPQALAQQLKATQQFTPATLGPDVLAQQLKLQQDSVNAQRLLQDAYTPLQGQMVSGHYVAPSWTQMAAQGLKAYLGQKAANDIPKQYLDLQRTQQANMAAQFGLGSQSMPSVAGQGVTSAQAMPVQQPQSAVPLLPGKSAQESFAIAQQIGMPAYLKLAVEQGKPTDLQQNLTAAGLQPGTHDFQRAVMAATARPINLAPGGTLIDPITQQPTITAPQNGIQTTYGPTGPVAAPVPGYSQANADIVGAQKRAEAQATASQDLVDVKMPDGTTQQMPRDQAANFLRSQGIPGAPSGASYMGKTLSPAMQTARNALPKTDAQITNMLDTIDKTLNHPGLPLSVGMGSMIPTIPGTKQADFRALADQLQGQTFLQAYDSLRGGGQITEVEGKKAESAIARLNSAQSVDAYKGALGDLKSILQTARNRAYQQAGINAPDASGVFSPKSETEFQALPSGSLFKDPNGVLRRKP